MKKITLFLAVLMLAALACTSVQFQDPSKTQTTSDQPDALATILADPAYQAQSTQEALDQAADMSDDQPEPTAQTEPSQQPGSAVASLTPTTAETPEATPTYSGFPTAIPLPNPRVTDFTTCLNECLSDGSNHQTSFPVKTELIHFRFEFDEFPISAPYTRVWTRNGVEWVRYTCYWPGPESGVEEITLTDPLGLPSGNWNVVITINGVEVVNEDLKIEGSWNQWSPPGYFNSCYGKR
ncbi:MAG TPA: hypothetical protein DCY42_03340 [Chloroflexi bacterium]|nr:hypothetical protein [Chloroflexota bacterium]